MDHSAWETEDEYAAAAQYSLPAPTDTPYRTPSIRSRRSSRKSVSPGPSSSPPPLPGGEQPRNSLDPTNDERISPFDPRRFTPTLHANLVAEILALRRDNDDKLKTIESLEDAIHETRGDHESLEDRISSTAKENRSLKRQLNLLEGGTASALSELAKERDEAVEMTTEIRRRLEVAQKKLKSRDEEASRVESLWEADKDNWAEERRKFERKIHVSDNRLKTVLEEVAAYEASHAKRQQQEPKKEENDTGHESDAGSVRTMSLTNSIRLSMFNSPNGYGVVRGNGVSLADELDLDTEDDQTDYEGRDSIISMKHKRNQSHESMAFRTHRRNQSSDSMRRPGSLSRGRVLFNQTVLDVLEAGNSEDDEATPAPKVKYVDTGIQYSPPPSPKLPPVLETAPILDALTMTEIDTPKKVERPRSSPQPNKEWEIEANQRRKRVSANPPLLIEPPKTSPMVSAASQTVDVPLSPPRTPVSPTRAPPPPPFMMVEEQPAMASASTQTDNPQEEKNTRPQSPKRTPPPIPIPTIQLHPPSSGPATPRESLLPPHSKDVGCQVCIQDPIPTRSISVQTEEIRIDQRLNLLPPHLHPSVISSSPPSPEPTAETFQFSLPDKIPPKNPRRMNSQQSVTTIPSSPPTLEASDFDPGNNDNGPLAKGKESARRPHRISSLFTGFDVASSDDGDNFDGDVSDNDFRTALSAPKPVNGTSRRMPPAVTSVPRNIVEQFEGKSNKNVDAVGDQFAHEVESLPKRSSARHSRQFGQPLSLFISKPVPIRRTALIQSGVAAHQGRARSPNELEGLESPPFPIPARASSRRPLPPHSAPADGTRSPTYGRGPRGIHRVGSVRKVRSTTTLQKAGQAARRSGSKSPPMSPSTESPESPRLPPLPRNDITTPRLSRDTASSRYRTHRHQLSATNTAITTNTAPSVNTDNQSANSSTTVVDAVAQTMVGEWMFKYVRRRKSFGVVDSNQDVNSSNGARHKRWVWLAPYERAVMWSSKQPTSGPALLGKTGRKLTIQSVLDVKDDNSPPKGSAPLFNRSILILTPARALKFTAVSRERHYVWLTALSFLAHSSQAVPEILTPQRPPTQESKPPLPDFELPKQPGRFQRNNKIRDSIRVAKGKTGYAPRGSDSIHSSSQHTTSTVTNAHDRDDELFFTTQMSDPADPPFIPRFERERGANVHVRKRSNTGPRIPPPLSFRGFSAGHAPSIAGVSVNTSGSSDNYSYNSQPPSVLGHNGVSSRSSIRTSDASSRPGNNFFDAVGTVRMEAFISPMGVNQLDDCPDEQDEMDMVSQQRRHSRDKRRSRRHKDSWSSRGLGSGRAIEDWYGGSKTAGEEESHEEKGDRFGQDAREDPFTGF